MLLNGEKLKAFPLRSKTRQVYPPLSLLFNIALIALARAIREKEEKHQNCTRRHENIPDDT